MELLGFSSNLKKKVIFSCAVALVFAGLARAQGILPGVYSTGVDDSGNVLPAGQTDPHYAITSSPLGALSALTVAAIPPEWTPNTAASGWINATGSGDGTETLGVYTYTLLFSLDSFDPATVEISGEWASDNESEIFLNGVDTGFSCPTNGFGAFNPFSLTSGFTAGENQLQFLVTQEPLTGGGSINPEGLQVDISSATASPVPEPATFSLLGLAGLLLLGRLPKKSNIRGIPRPSRTD